MRAPDQRLASFGQAVSDRVGVARRAGERIVLSVYQADDPDAARHPSVERLRRLGERTRTFERQPGANAGAVATARQRQPFTAKQLGQHALVRILQIARSWSAR